MNVGLCTISAKERSLEEVLELAGEVGYDGVEIWGRDHVGDSSHATCERISETAEEHGLSIPVYGSYLRCGTDGFDEEMDHELEITDRLGADLVRVWAGRAEYGNHDPGHWDQVVSDLERLTERAAAYDVGVTVEKHANTLTNDLEGAQRLIEAVDDERCRLNYQPGFGIPAEELEHEGATLASLSNNVHVQAVSEIGESERALLSDAYYDLETILAPFFENFDGYANVEFVTADRPYRDAIDADLRYLRSVIER